MTEQQIIHTPEVTVEGQCAWCLKRQRQAFALVCPEHVSDWRNTLDDLQRDIKALCRAVGEFDGARPSRRKSCSRSAPSGPVLCERRWRQPSPCSTASPSTALATT